MYHLPVTRGAGWSWGPRNADKAWGVGVGVANYADVKQWDRQEQLNSTAAAKEPWPSNGRSDDIESGILSGAETGDSAMEGGKRHDRV